MSSGIGSDPGGNAPVNPQPNSPPPAENASALSAWGWAAAILAVGVVVGLVVLTGVWTYQRFTGAPFVPDASQQQTEAKFQSFVFGAADPTQSDSLDEWRAARSDHKIIAYSVARCLGLDTTKNMTPAVFSMLMLDLWPDGDHWWGRGSRKTSSNSGASPEPAVQETAAVDPSNEPAASQSPKLTPSWAAMLAISDEVARARLSAARGANNFYPMMSQFGWLSVIVSAIATALVTLKASMNSEHYPRWSMTIGICAVALSTAATVLAGAKQFFDPTGAYMRNESALVALRQLHAEVALDFVSRSTCDDSDLDARSFARWRNTLISLENGTIFAPVIVAAPSNPLGQGADSVEPPPVVRKPEHPTTAVVTPPSATPPAEKAADQK